MAAGRVVAAGRAAASFLRRIAASFAVLVKTVPRVLQLQDLGTCTLYSSKTERRAVYETNVQAGGARAPKLCRI